MLGPRNNQKLKKTSKFQKSTPKAFTIKIKSKLDQNCTDYEISQKLKKTTKIQESTLKAFTIKIKPKLHGIRNNQNFKEIKKIQIQENVDENMRKIPKRNVRKLLLL